MMCAYNMNVNTNTHINITLYTGKKKVSFFHQRAKVIQYCTTSLFITSDNTLLKTQKKKS